MLEELSTSPDISFAPSKDGPSAELDASLGDPILPVIAQIASTAQHPFSTHPHQTTAPPLLPYDRHATLACLPVPRKTSLDPGIRRDFLPDPSEPGYSPDVILPDSAIVKALNDHFCTAMRMSTLR